MICEFRELIHSRATTKHKLHSLCHRCTDRLERSRLISEIVQILTYSFIQHFRKNVTLMQKRCKLNGVSNQQSEIASRRAAASCSLARKICILIVAAQFIHSSTSAEIKSIQWKVHCNFVYVFTLFIHAFHARLMMVDG